MPLVSIIIPNYNHAAYLFKRIESVINQTFNNYEIIILDDCSTDNSGEIIENYRKHSKVKHIVYNKKNSGSTFKQWKKGISLAKGKFIWIAESDDYCEPVFLETLASTLINNNEIGLAYSKSIRVDENGKYMDDFAFWYEDLDVDRWANDYENQGLDEIKEFFIKKNIIPNASAVVFRKDLIKFNLNILKDFYLCGDWLFWIRLIEKTRIAYHSRPLNFFRTHNNSVRSSEQGKNKYGVERRRIIIHLLKRNHITKSYAESVVNLSWQPEIKRKISKILKLIFLRK